MAARLFNPLDPFVSPPGDAAWDHVIDVGDGVLGYAKRAISDPSFLREDLPKRGHQANVDFNPFGTPMADTLTGEIRRDFHVGANDGELGVNLAMLPLGGEAFEGISALRLAGAEARAGLLPKFYPQAADYFGELYDATGHHYFSQRGGRFANVGGAPLAAPLTALPLPRFLRDSEIFRYRPDGITNAEMFAHHFQSDPEYFGGRIPAEYGGGGWSGRKAGLQKLSPPLRMWHGASLPLKVAVGAGVLGGAAASSYLDDWSQH